MSGIPGDSRRRASARSIRAAAVMARSLPSALARGRYFIPAVGCQHEACRADHGEHPSYPLRHHLRSLDGVVRQVENTEDHSLVAERAQHSRVEAGLGGLDRHLVTGAFGQFGQERITRRAVMDDGRIAEADVYGGRALETPSKARFNAEMPKARAASGRAWR